MKHETRECSIRDQPAIIRIERQVCMVRLTTLTLTAFKNIKYDILLCLCFVVARRIIRFNFSKQAINGQYRAYRLCIINLLVCRHNIESAPSQYSNVAANILYFIIYLLNNVFLEQSLYFHTQNTNCKLVRRLS